MTPRHARQLDAAARIISTIATAEGEACDVDLEERLLDESQRLHDAVETREARGPSPEMQASDGLADHVEAVAEIADEQRERAERVALETMGK